MFNGNNMGGSRSVRRKSNGRRHARLNLSIDTTFSSHQGQAPRQIFPKSSTLIFNGSSDVETSRHDHDDPKITTNDILSRAGSHTISDSNTIPQSHLLQRRLKSSRLAPLNLSREISPSDCAITIGLSVPSARAASYAESRDFSHTQGRSAPLSATTPTIVITPAEYHFTDFDGDHRRRASSVYSRNTSHIALADIDDSTSVPPVPPIPRAISIKHSNQNGASALPKVNSNPDRGLTAKMSRGWNKQIVVPLLSRHIDIAPLTSQSHLPTPRRSKGWWNVLLSPFTAGKPSPAWWRSPLTEESDGLPLLEEEGSNTDRTDALHKGLILLDRSELMGSDDEIRSAPAVSNASSPITILRRSNTASGALDPHGTNTVDIYRIPSCGEAAEYYDPTRNFPSLYIDNVAKDVPIGWSPSHSVARSPRIHPQGSEPAIAAGFTFTPSTLDNIEGTDDESISSFGNSHKLNDTRRQPTIERGILSSPTAEELSHESLAQESPFYRQSRNSVHGVVQSHFSPMTMTTFSDSPPHSPPQSRPFSADEYETLRYGGRLPSSMEQTIPPLPRPVEDTVFVEKHSYTQNLNRPELTRNDSHGLGIVHADTNNSFFPPPRITTDKLELETDKFEQSETRSARTTQRPWHKRWIWLLIAAGVICLILLIVLLVLFLTGRGDKSAPIEAHWLNLTGFPALPVGVTTVVQPRLATFESGCVDPEILWSCSTPPANSISSRSVQMPTPNFRFEIRFKNHSTWQDAYAPTSNSSAHTVRARALTKRNSWIGAAFQALPPPPDAVDQLFLGKTTDNASYPYNGVETPFYISLVNPIQLRAKPNNESIVNKRDTSTSTSTTAPYDPYPYPTPVTTIPAATSVSIDAPTSIPKADVESNGQPWEQVLYPYVNAQPLRLYNRNTSNEHYGFYTYFDRTILVTLSPNDSRLLSGTNKSSETAGPTLAICTWSQTRFHVQIWTRRPVVEPLQTTGPGTPGPAAANSTANDFDAPGSFPLRTTITLDRHGGEADEKGVYCYALNAADQVIPVAKSWVAEDRAWEGVLVNPAEIPGVNSTMASTAESVGRRQSSGANDTQGGIDGGSGGCACKWQNWDLL